MVRIRIEGEAETDAGVRACLERHFRDHSGGVLEIVSTMSSQDGLGILARLYFTPAGGPSPAADHEDRSAETVAALQKCGIRSYRMSSV